jgi:DNA mismatch repair protein MSH2
MILIVPKASPGNLVSLDSLLFSTHSLNTSPILLSLKISPTPSQQGNVILGLSYIDTSSREIGMLELEEDGESFANLESTIIQLGVKDVLISEMGGEGLKKKLKSLTSKVMEEDDMEEEVAEEKLQERLDEERQQQKMKTDYLGMRVRNVMERCGVVITERKKKEFERVEEREIEKAVNPLLKGSRGFSSMRRSYLPLMITLSTQLLQ